MRRVARAAALTCLVAIAASAPATAERFDDLRAQARDIVQRFEAQLTHRLNAALESGDIDDMMGVFDREAVGIAAYLSADTGWEVGWTSLDIRDPANAPSEREARILQAFQALVTDRVRPHAMEYVATVANDFGEKRLHYMMAIPTDDVCLICHGESIAPEIAAELRERYPDDHATGFKPGELRGAYTLYKRIN